MRFVSYHYRSALQIMGAGICPSVSTYGRKRTFTRPDPRDIFANRLTGTRRYSTESRAFQRKRKPTDRWDLQRFGLNGYGVYRTPGPWAPVHGQ